MKKKTYMTPQLKTETMAVGVFGCYGSGLNGLKPGGFFRPRRRRRGR